jgi:NAD(P)-dependent dehydrogenase (short-subunit alcohol dehydrogenase family)
MSTDKPLAGRTALVTGGAGGIGAACARELARDGATVLLMGRRLEALEAARAALLEAVPQAQLAVHAGDACEESQLRAALASAHAMQNRLDIVVATVGGGSFRPLLMLDAAAFRAELEANLVSAFLAVRHGAPLLRRGGSIVCISSTAAHLTAFGLSAYNTTKGALETFVRNAADELGSAGIRVNAVRPGLTRTGATAGMYQDPQLIAQFVAQIPLGRTGEPQDIAPAVRFLAGPESAWMTGQSFAVDGGQELRRMPDQTGLIGQLFGREALERVLAGQSP